MLGSYESSYTENKYCKTGCSLSKGQGIFEIAVTFQIKKNISAMELGLRFCSYFCPYFICAFFGGRPCAQSCRVFRGGCAWETVTPTARHRDHLTRLQAISMGSFHSGFSFPCHADDIHFVSMAPGAVWSWPCGQVRNAAFY